jgi:hypothetical protein
MNRSHKKGCHCFDDIQRPQLPLNTSQGWLSIVRRAQVNFIHRFPLMKPCWISSSVVALICFTSCDNGLDHLLPAKSQEIITVNQKSALPYRIVPTASDSVTVSFIDWVGHHPLKSATLLTSDGTRLVTVELKDPTIPPSGTYSGIFSYEFDPSVNYNFSVESEVVKDTIFHYKTGQYRHLFKSSFEYEKLTDLSSWYDYDIDPLRSTLFVIDRIADDVYAPTFVLKKISTTDFSVATLAYVPNASGLVRALSDHEILTDTRNWESRILTRDSAALIRVDLNTGVQQFVDWTSQEYQKVSRIVKGHIIYTGPYVTSHSSTMLNVASGDRKIYSWAELNPFSIREDNFDNIYAGETIYNWTTGHFEDILHIKDPSSILYIDDQTSFTFVIEQVPITDWSYPHFRMSSRLTVYKENAISVCQKYEDSAYPQLGNIVRVKDNNVIYYKYTTFATQPEVEGYYALDLQTGESQLLHCEKITGGHAELMLDDNTMLSLRHADGVYKITIP